MTKLNREQILRNLLQTLVDGWGYTTVVNALDNLSGAAQDNSRFAGSSDVESPRRAIDLVGEIDIAPESKKLLFQIAERFDEGVAFPKIGDIRAFLISHHQDASGIKGRIPAFRRILPILSRMSPKGLEKVLVRSHHSGPAELGVIADAIRGAGEDLRGNSTVKLEPSAERLSQNDHTTNDDISKDNRTGS